MLGKGKSGSGKIELIILIMLAHDQHYAGGFTPVYNDPPLYLKLESSLAASVV